MKLHGAVIREQGITFAVVVVKPHAMSSDSTARETMVNMQSFFPGMPIALASQDSRGRFRYHGRNDLVNFLASIDPSRIPWKEYTFS